MYIYTYIYIWHNYNLHFSTSYLILLQITPPPSQWPPPKKRNLKKRKKPAVTMSGKKLSNPFWRLTNVVSIEWNYNTSHILYLTICWFQTKTFLDQCRDLGSGSLTSPFLLLLLYHLQPQEKTSGWWWNAGQHCEVLNQLLVWIQPLIN